MIKSPFRAAAFAVVGSIALAGCSTYGGYGGLSYGGGYGVVDVVPRSWTHLLAVALDRDVDPATPTPVDWRESAAQAARTVAADFATDVAVDTMGDGATTDFDRWEGNWGQEAPEGVPAHLQQATDAAIMATRSAVFPLRGLDPGDPRD